MFSHGKDRTLFGKPIQQTWSSLYVLEKLLAIEQPTFIIELGTANGMLAHYLNTYSFLSMAGFATYDITKPKFRTAYNFYEWDVTKDSTQEHVSDFLNNAKKPLLLVDAFDPKSIVVNMYVPLLKSGTIVLAHDYIQDESKSFKWGFRDENINCWNKLEKFEPYYSLSKEYDTRMFYGIIK